MKNSLWSFANIASTVCVSDDSSCEKIRLSLEDCEVEKDIAVFIKENSTGQEIPDPPKFIDFCRGDVNDNASDISGDDNNYSVAQFQRTMNPAFRSSSPQPSTLESHHDPDSMLADEMRGSRGDPDATPRKSMQDRRSMDESFRSSHGSQGLPSREEFPEVPHNEYPPDGMTQFCRLPPPSENGSSVASPVRPLSRDSHSELSANSFTSPEPSLGTSSPTKGMSDLSQRSGPDDGPHKKKSGFFSNRSPFKRKDKSVDVPSVQSTARSGLNQPPPPYGRQAAHSRTSPSPEPGSDFQLSIGDSVFNVASPDKRSSRQPQAQNDALDEVAQALAAVKDMTKQSTSRVSADRYAGLQTPAPSSSSGSSANQGRPMPDRSRNAPPPSYNGPPPPVSRLDAPQPAHTSRHMQQTTQAYQNRNSAMLTGSNVATSNAYGRPPQQARPQSRAAPEPSRAPSPGPPRRSPSPRPGQGNLPRAASPNPYLNGGRESFDTYQNRPRAQSSSPTKPRPQDAYQQGPGSAGRVPYGTGRPAGGIPRAASPTPGYQRPPPNAQPPRSRPTSGNFDGAPNMAVQLAPAPAQPYQRPQSVAGGYGAPPPRRPGTNAGQRPMSSYDASAGASAAMNHGGHARTHSAGGGGQQMTRDGRPILHFSRAMYMYTAAIPEELTFAKNDVLAVLRHQDDGWWEAEVCGKRGRGLVPSNYLGNA